jgi:hypothetical protein
MGLFSLPALVVVGSLLGSMAIDVGLNTLQNWYDVIYADAFWSYRPGDVTTLAGLHAEEGQIDALMRSDGFAASGLEPEEIDLADALGRTATTDVGAGFTSAAAQAPTGVAVP